MPLTTKFHPYSAPGPGFKAAGFPDLPLEKILEFQIHDIDKDYILYCRELLKGKKELTLDLVVKMKINGI